MSLSRSHTELAEWQEAIFKIINDLLSAPTREADAAVNCALDRIGRLNTSDRTCIFRLRKGGRLDNTHEWTASGIEPMIAKLQDMPATLIDEWLPEIGNGRVMHIPDVGTLSKTSAVREVLLMQAIRSFLAVPMLRNGKIVGFVGFSVVRATQQFLQTEIQSLKAVVNVIGFVIDRYESHIAAEAAQAELQTQRDHLKSTSSAIHDLVLEFDQDGRVLTHIESAKLHSLALPTELLGRMPEDVLPPEFAALVRHAMKVVNILGEIRGLECELTIEDVSHCYTLAATARHEQSTPSGYIILIRDITKQVCQRRHIQRLGKIAELTSNLVIVTDAELRIEWVNPAFERHTGWKLEEIIGQRPHFLLASENTYRAEMRRICAALRENKPIRAELLNRTRYGKEYWNSVDIQPLCGNDGRNDGFVAVQTDITEMKISHQKALHDRAAALDISGDGIAIADANGFFRYMNAAHRRLFGIPRDEDISALNWRNLYDAETLRHFTAHRWEELQAHKHWRGELTGVHSDGRAVVQEVSLTLHGDDILCVTRDISDRLREATERGRLRDRLQRAQRQEMVAQFAGGVAHELNNLVAVVAGSLSLLETKGIDEEDATVSLERIKRATQTARNLVNGLGNLSRPKAKRSIHDLRDLILDSTKLLGSNPAQAREISLMLPDTPCPVWANETELLQVIVNLSLNACEACQDPTATVRVAVCPDCAIPERAPDAGVATHKAKFAVFKVSDHGSGIDPKLHDQLFERYFTTKGKYGTGLGLPIVASILRDNGAALWIDSKPGLGTEITVSWPSHEPSDEAKMFVSDRRPSADVELNNCNILVVDDLEDVADVLSEFLEVHGANAIAVTDPMEAAALLKDSPGTWAALVTDLNMPKMSGTALAEIAAVCTPPIPVILITALPEAIGPNTGHVSGILCKPVDPTQLVNAVRAAIGKAMDNATRPSALRSRE